MYEELYGNCNSQRRIHVVMCPYWEPNANTHIVLYICVVTRKHTRLPHVFCLTFSWFVPYHFLTHELFKILKH